MKKIVLLLLISFIIVSPLCAKGAKDKSKSFSMADLATNKISDFDAPLLDSISYFASSFFSFNHMAMSLAAGIGFLGIIWCAFKIIFGTENVRKAAVDIMCKFLIFTFVMALYPKIIYGLLDTATTIGMLAGGGRSRLVSDFTQFRMQMEKKVEIARKSMEAFLYATHRINGEDKTFFTETMLEEMTSRFIVSDEEREKYIQEARKRYNFIPRDDELEALRYMKEGGTLNISKENMNLYYSGEVFTSLKDITKAIRKKNVKTLLKDIDSNEDYNSPAVKHAIISLRAMDEVFKTNPDYDPNNESSKDTVSQYLFAPFMRDKNGKQTKLLSPGAMIKIGIVISDIINYRTYNEIDDDGNMTPKYAMNPEKKTWRLTWKDIQDMIFSLIFTLAMLAACVFFAIQYCMTIFEYFIITSVGILFVPCILWDGTKSFAAKLVTLFLAYFFKLMLTIFCIFWVYSFFIQMGANIMTNDPVLSTLNVGYFLFAVMLGWVVTQNGPKLATALLNGTPDLSMGEFMRAAGTAAAGAYMAKKAATGLKSAGQTAHKGLQKGVNKVGGTIAAVQGVNKAVDKMGDEQGWSKGKRFQKRVGAMLGLAGQGIKDSASTFFTGVENKGSKEQGRSNMGGGKSPDNDRSADGKQTFGDASDGAFNFAYEPPPNTPQNNQPQNNPPPDTPPSFPGQRDTDAG